MCRAIPREHIPKKMGDLENPITHGKVFDDTHDRIHGPKQDETYFHFNHSYGAAKNPVDDFPKIGKRQELLEASVRARVAQQMQELERERDKIANSRSWETTNKAELRSMDLTMNAVGRRLMKTPDGVRIPPRSKESMLDQRIGAEIDRKKLQERLPKGHYTVTEPVTFYTQHLERKNFYMSAATGVNPFARSSAMTQIAADTRAARNYEGNVNFDRAGANVDTFLKSNAIYKPGK